MLYDVRADTEACAHGAEGSGGQLLATWVSLLHFPRAIAP